MAVSITGATGTLSHGSALTIVGSGFGSKATAAPLVWDDCSGTDPLVKWDFAWPYQNDEAFRLTYRRPIDVTTAAGAANGVALPHGNITKYLAGCHYSSGAWDATAGWNVCFGKNGQQGQTLSYLSFYTRIDPNWSWRVRSGPGVEYDYEEDRNYKDYDYAAGDGPYGAAMKNTYFNIFGIDEDSTCRWGVNYLEGMEVTIYDDNYDICHWDQAYDTVWGQIDVPSHRLGWHKVEMLFEHNTVNGRHRIWQDNVLVWDMYVDDDGGVAPEARMEMVGGFARDCGQTNPFKNNWRYYADVYYDHSPSRVMVGDAATYAACTKIEPQPPAAWSDTEIEVTINQAALSAIAGSYLYVFDSTGTPNADGYALSGQAPASPIIFGIRR